MKNLNEKRFSAVGERKGFKGVESISFDKMWTYVGVRRGEKRNSKYIWTAVIRDGDQEIVTYEIGDRDEVTFLKVMEKDTFC
ncbi:hypothetical protein JCM12825_03570 [Desulfurobacterium crinifex]